MVVNANFNQAYKNGSVVVIDLAALRIVPEWTIPVGTFAGEALFNHAGTRLFVSVRGPFLEQDGIPDEPEDVVIAFDIDTEAAVNPPGDRPLIVPESRNAIRVAPDPFGMSMDFRDRYLYVSHVSNGEMTVIQDDLGRFTNEADREAMERGESIRRCIPTNLYCPGNTPEGDRCGSCEDNASCRPREEVLEGEMGGIPMSWPSTCLEDIRRPGRRFCADFCEVDVTETDEDGLVTRVGCPTGYACEEIGLLQAVTERKFSRGGNQVAISPLTGSVYVTHRDANAVGILRPYRVDGLGFRARVQQTVFDEGIDLRGIAFNPEGDKLFIAGRNIIVEEGTRPGVLVIDTRLTYDGCSRDAYVGNGTSCEKNKLVDFIEVDAEPANIAFYKEFLYVPLYDTDEMYVIDTRSRQVMDVVDLAPEAFIRQPGIFRHHARPYEVAIFENSAGAWALVTHFEAHEVAVLQLFDALGNPINRVDRKIENRAKLYEEDRY